MDSAKAQIFLTVGSSKQKKLCEKILTTTDLKDSYNLKIISDDDLGIRLGSGGAVLKIVGENYIPGSKMLIINSGGMSKRSINYAIKGKALSNVLYKNEEKTLLEVILSNAQVILNSIPSGIVCCCSDILVETEGIQLPSLNNSTTFCIRTDLNTASQHGVMMSDDNGILTHYLHKLSPEELNKFLPPHSESALVDTGLNYFSDTFSSELYQIAKSQNSINFFDEHSFEINLFSDIITLLSKNTDKDIYLKTETENLNHQEFKEFLYNRLSSFSMNVYEITKQEFMHFGSSQGALNNIFKLAKSNSTHISFNSFIDSTSHIGTGTITDNVQVSSCNIGSNCIVSDIHLENIEISDNKAVCGFKLTDGSFVCVICDINEDPKVFSGSQTLWETKRFYKAPSFTASLEKFYNSVSEPTFSMAYCIENADYDYYFNSQQYLLDMKTFSLNETYLNIRNEIIKQHFISAPVIKTATCLKNRVEISLPLRINLSGTWTDAMPYCIEHGGEVVNAAVKINGEKPIKITIEKLENKNIEFYSDGNKLIYNFESFENDLSDFNLHKAVLEVAGFSRHTILENGFRLTTNVTNIDKGSGLGISSILIGGCLKAINAMFGFKQDLDQLIKSVFVAEQIMKTGGGWQDQAGGLTPGLKLCASNPGIKQQVSISPIQLSPFFKRIFSEKLVLLPTGQRHFGRFIVNDVSNNYLCQKEQTLTAYEKNKQLNHLLLKCLESDDYNGFISCINSHHNLLNSFSHKITNAAIDRMVEKCMEKADAVSILGAGGGGYLLVVLKPHVSFDDFKIFTENSFPQITSELKRIDLCYDI